MSVADLDFIFPAALAADLSDEAFRRGYQLITQQTRLSSDYEHAMMNSASAQICDGTIVCWPSSDLDAMADFAATHPLVVLDSHGLEGRVDNVLTPNRDGARAAVTHLIERGARRVLVLGTRYLPPEELARMRDSNGTQVGNASLRLCGAWEAMDGHDMPYEPEDVCPCGWGRGYGYERRSRRSASTCSSTASRPCMAAPGSPLTSSPLLTPASSPVASPPEAAPSGVKRGETRHLRHAYVCHVFSLIFGVCLSRFASRFSCSRCRSGMATGGWTRAG